MNETDLKEAKEATKRLAVIANQIEARLEQTGKRQEQIANAMAKTAMDADRSQDERLKRLDIELQQKIELYIKEAFIAQRQFIDTEFESSLDKIRQLNSFINDERLKTSKMAGLMTWKAVVGIGIAYTITLLGLGGTYWYFSSEVKKAKLNAEVVQAWQLVEPTVCGNDPCFQLNKNARKWGNGKYVVIKKAD